jgi:L-ascorbate metabolism protein UlaG (beta-lactamase superfamily)
MKRPVRHIRDELYRDRGYDAIWRLPNAGFVLRLDNRYIFLDPVLSSPHRYYEAIRQQIQKTGQLPHHEVELQRHDLDAIATEVHETPLRAEEAEQADYVFITHGHEDHLDDDAIGVLAKLGPQVMAPGSCHPRLTEAGLQAGSLSIAVHGETHDYGDFSVEVVPADHSNSVAATVNTDACGYLLRTAHGNFFLPGDGRFDHEGKEHIARMDVDYLLVPINDTNLGVGFAALLTSILQPKVVVPCHYGYTYPPVRSQGGHPAEFVSALVGRGYDIPTTDIVILSPGGRLVLA